MRYATIISLFLTILFSANLCVSAEYFVDTTGNDGNAGDSEHPWATLSKAASVAVSGDVINIASGSYPGYAESSATGRTGYITYRGGGVKPTVMGITLGYSAKTSAWLKFENINIYDDDSINIVSITNADNVSIDGCDINAGKWYYSSSNATTGISIVSSSGISITDNHFFELGQGVDFISTTELVISRNWMQIKGGTPIRYLGNGSGITVSRNNITGASYVPYPDDPDAFESIHQSAVSIRGDGITIEENYFFGLANGIMTYIQDVIGGEDSYDNILIENNSIYNIESGTAMLFYNAGKNIVVRNNSVFAKMYPGSCGDGTSADSRYRYNTALLVASLADGEDGGEISLYNNIFAGTVYAPSTVADANNIFWSLADMTGSFKSAPYGGTSMVIAITAGGCGVFPDEFSTTKIFRKPVEPVTATPDMRLSVGSTGINYGNATLQPGDSLGQIVGGYVSVGGVRSVTAHSTGAFEMVPSNRYRLGGSFAIPQDSP